MVGRRKQLDGLPGRLYCRPGIRKTVFFIKNPDNTNTILAEARTGDKETVRHARAKAIEEYGRRAGTTPDTVAELIDEYFLWQASLPPNHEKKKAPSTIAGNLQETKNLRAFFGSMSPHSVEARHCYAFIDERTETSGAAIKAGKEITLLSAIFERGRRRGKLRDNIARGVEIPRGAPSQTVVKWEQVEHFAEVGRKAGGPYHIMGLAAVFAWLTVKRSNEVRNFQRQQIVTEGCMFTGSKRKAGAAVMTGLIEWSPLLRANVDEALTVQRWGENGIPSRYVFGNLAGRPYTKGGWKANWARLHAIARAAWQGSTPWEEFSLQDCRPGGITEKQGRGDGDTVDATLHSNGRMVAAVYDRRRVRVAKPAL